LDYLARTVPITHRLAIKEHPAMVGGVDYGRVADLLRRHDALVLLRPSISNFDVLRRADAVVTVNSKSGAEAILLNRPVVALGDSFYRRSGLVRAVGSLDEIGEALREVMAAPPRSSGDIYGYFQQVWDRSYPGELYATDEAGCSAFAESLLRYIVSSPSQRESAGRTV
ncbi:MAG: capsule biosynthesis protein, partial [bacterium]